MENTFSKKERLKSRKTIELLFKKGKSINDNPIRAVYLPKEEIEGVVLNMAVSVPKKKIKLAVGRNLVKRRIREAYRLNNKALKLQLQKTESGFDIMFIYHSSQILTYQEIETKIKVILNRLTDSLERVGE